MKVYRVVIEFESREEAEECIMGNFILAEVAKKMGKISVQEVEV